MLAAVFAVTIATFDFRSRGFVDDRCRINLFATYRANPLRSLRFGASTRHMFEVNGSGF